MGFEDDVGGIVHATNFRFRLYPLRSKLKQSIFGVVVAEVGIPS